MARGCWQDIGQIFVQDMEQTLLQDMEQMFLSNIEQFLQDKEHMFLLKMDINVDLPYKQVSFWSH